MAGMPWVAVKVGKAMSGSIGLEAGQDTMNAEARVYTSFKPSAVPNGFAGATSPKLKRWMEVCRLSVTRIEPATPRYALLVIKPAPPR